MPFFVITATDENGKRELHNLEAENTQDAYNFLESNGFVDIILHTDDVTAIVFPKPLNTYSSVEGFISPDLLENQNLTSVGFLCSLLKRLYWKFRWLELCAIGIFVFKWSSGLILSSLSMVMIAVLLFPGIIALWATLFSFSRKYHQFLAASFWGRWQEVLDLIPKLEGIIPDFDLACKAGCSLAAQGQLEKGLEILKPYADSPEVPHWIYLHSLVNLFIFTKEYNQALECARLAAEEVPEIPIIKLDYAYELLKYTNENELAEQLLDETEKMHLDEWSKLFLKYLRGLLALNTGNSEKAKEKFLACQQATPDYVANLPPFQYFIQHALQHFIDMNEAYLAIVLAELDDREQADEIYQRVLPRLQALDYTRTMDRYAEIVAR